MLLLLGVLGTSLHAQTPSSGSSPEDTLSRQAVLTLQRLERDMMQLGDSMLDAHSDEAKINALRRYVPMLVRALKVDYSFYYPFDSLRFMFKLKPEDGRFRMLNWNLQLEDGAFRYFGAIQMAPGQPSQQPVYPLFDRSPDLDASGRPHDTLLGPDQWYGAQFYAIRRFPQPGDSSWQYVLLGWDGHQPGNNRKIIDVIRFRENGEPQFGAPIFERGPSASGPSSEDPMMATRRFFTFKEDAYMTLRFIPERPLIAIANLVPFKDPATGQQHMVPDGGYNYYQCRDGRFFFGEDLFSSFRDDYLPVEGPEGTVREDGTVEQEERKRPRKERLFRHR